MSYWMWEPRKTAGQRRADAARRVQDAARRGRPLSPVVLAGRTIASTFWGKAWCDNLERYKDFAYRLDRGRSYVRSGSVIDLQIRAGVIAATVCGSDDYEVEIKIGQVSSATWRAIKRDCAGSVRSLLDLLAGKLSSAVMTRLCADGTGLFPARAEIDLRCTCPDYAGMCKHVAATMYGVGARLDASPELLFTLRGVSADELLGGAALPSRAPSASRVLATDGLAALFGIELDGPAPRAKPDRRMKAAAPKATVAKVAKPAAKARAVAPSKTKPASTAKTSPSRGGTARATATKPPAARRPRSSR